MPSGNLLVPAENVYLLAASRSWMVEHFFHTSHGPRELLTKTYATNTQYVGKKYGKAVVVFETVKREIGGMALQ